MEASCPVQDQRQFDTIHRTVFSRGEATVRGFPSTGGILILPLDAAAASHLNLPRFSPVTRAASADEEDAFCTRLRLLGAKWWPSENNYVQKLIGAEDLTSDERKELVVGCPSANGEGHGGVLILRAQSARDLPEDFYMSIVRVAQAMECDFL